MADKKITIQIAGHDITLNFGANYFYRYFKEDMGLDIATEGFVDVEQFDRVLNYTIGFIYCGHKAECAMNRTDVVHKLEDVEHWVMSMSMSEVREMVLEFLSKMTGKTVDELKNAETQAAQNGMAKVEVG